MFYFDASWAHLFYTKKEPQLLWLGVISKVSQSSKKCNKQYKSLFLRECMPGGRTSWNAKPKYCNLNKATCTTFLSTMGKNTGSLVDVVIYIIISDLTTFTASELVRAPWLLTINLAGLKSQYIPLKLNKFVGIETSPSIWTQSYGK